MQTSDGLAEINHPVRVDRSLVTLNRLSKIYAKENLSVQRNGQSRNIQTPTAQKISINQYSFIQRPKWHSRILVVIYQCQW